MVDINDIYGLAYSCPLSNRKKDCFFHAIDHLSFREKLKWIGELEQEEKVTIINNHNECSRNKNNSK